MSWLRFGGLVAAAALATSVAVACGDTTSITIVDVVDSGAEANADGAVVSIALDAGVDADQSVVADASLFDADAPTDAAGDGSACNRAPVATMSDDCFATTDCPMQCAAGPAATFYACSNGGRPPLSNCYDFPAYGPGACCPSACVRRSSQDNLCSRYQLDQPPTTHAYFCLLNKSDGVTAAPPPSPSCTQGTLAPDGNNIYVCCP